MLIKANFEIGSDRGERVVIKDVASYQSTRQPLTIAEAISAVTVKVSTYINFYVAMFLLNQYLYASGGFAFKEFPIGYK